jgi:hypothetical protein
MRGNPNKAVRRPMGVMLAFNLLVLFHAGMMMVECSIQVLTRVQWLNENECDKSRVEAKRRTFQTTVCIMIK